MYDLIIIGGGPAGVSAGVYAGRKRIKTLLITEEVGGQSTVSEGIENWIGTVKISGGDLKKSFKEHIDAYKGDVLSLEEGVRVTSLSKNENGFVVQTNTGKAYHARAVLIASGAGRRTLDIPGAKTFEHKGVVYCASCDGPLFSGMEVAVIGGGNAGFETAAQLLAYAKSVTLIHKYKDFKADAITVEKVLAHEHMKAIKNASPVEIKGEKFVQELIIEDNDTNERTVLPVQGVFVEIGVIPNTDFAKEVLSLDAYGRIKVDARNQKTEVGGVWAAGDCTDELYHQNNIAAGDGVKALEDIYLWLKRQ